MEIKENEFVRTDNGIFKVTKIDGLYIYLDKQYFDNQYQTMRDVTFKERIVNHSFNIIDLIEEGDYVNEQKVLCLKKNNDDCRDDIGTSYIEGIDIYLGYDESEIKTILTHEQYERNCYRLEDN